MSTPGYNCAYNYYPNRKAAADGLWGCWLGFIVFFTVSRIVGPRPNKANQDFFCTQKYRALFGFCMDTGVCAGVQRVLEDHGFPNSITVMVTAGGGYVLFTLFFLRGNGGGKSSLGHDTRDFILDLSQLKRLPGLVLHISSLFSPTKKRNSASEQ